MVIGNGLIAKAFNKFMDVENIIIFASGVSNSNETSDSEFDTEFNLLKECINNLKDDQIIVYFSTVSIFDNSLRSSKYIKHKFKIEEFLSQKCKNYMIFRLPIVISNSENPNTLINFLINKIKNKQDFTLYSNACRYIIDIDDVMNVCKEKINKFSSSRIENIVFDNRIKVIELVNIIENIYNEKAKFQIIEKGECYEVPDLIKGELLELYAINLNNYVKNKLEKYKTNTKK